MLISNTSVEWRLIFYFLNIPYFSRSNYNINFTSNFIMFYKFLFISFFFLFLFSTSILADDTSGSTSGASKLKVLVLSKEDMQLSAYDGKGNLVMQFAIATGENYGNKKVRGDKKTPEGVFKIVEINNASNWSHDFRDGKGVIKNAYGNYFIRLSVPNFRSIGIHGTHAPESIGTRASEGCIRLNNAHLDSLVAHLDKTETIVILPALEDVLVNQNIETNSKEFRVKRFIDRITQPVLHLEPYTMLPRIRARLNVPYLELFQHQIADVEHLEGQCN